MPSNHTPPEPSFRAEALVYGVIGDFSGTATYIPHGARELPFVVETKWVRLMSNRKLRSWRSRSGQGWFWHPLDRNIGPRSWKETQIHAMAPGVAEEDEAVRLHNDHLGVHELYYCSLDGVVVLSNWLPLLVEASDPHKADPRAWASIFLLGFPTPGRSQFDEIKSLPPYSSLLIRAGAIRVENSDPTAGGDSREPSDVIEAISESLPRDRTRTVIYPLSGGWDSRLLAGVARRRQQRIETWTSATTYDFAPDRTDILLARTVAGQLQTRHREVHPPSNYGATAIDSNLARNHCSTWLHSWLEPFAARIRDRGCPVVDALGAVWIKGFLQRPDDDRQGVRRDVRHSLWERLGGRTGYQKDVWSDRARALFEDCAFQDFDDVVRRFSEAHTWQTLSILTTRTARAISLAPLRLFGPEADVFVPLITSRTLEAALSPEIYRQRGDQFAETLIGLANPALARIISTNHTTIKARRRAIAPEFHPDTLKRLMSTIGACEPALDLLAPGLARVLVEQDMADLAPLMSHAGPYRAVMGVYAYATWLNRHSNLNTLVLG